MLAAPLLVAFGFLVMQGPKWCLAGVIAQNGVVYAERFGGSPGGTVSGSTIFGIGDDQQLPTPDLAVQPAILVAGATNVTITNNTLTSDPNHTFGPDGGVIVMGGDQTITGTGTPSTGIVISFNHIERADPDGADPNGFGVWVVPNQQATLICNTFSNWKTNVVGAIQMSCTPLPDGTECESYSANQLTVEGGTSPSTWSLESGTLPPGLTLSPTDASITGTPTQAGTFDFTPKVMDSSEPSLTTTEAQTITIAPDCAAPTAAAPAAVAVTPHFTG